jgi:hypothetical protein
MISIPLLKWLSMSCLAVIMTDASMSQTVAQPNPRASSSSFADESQTKFDVATIKESHSKNGVQFLNALIVYPGGRIVFHGATVAYLLM